MRSRSPPPLIPPPTTLLRWRHCFALQAKRRSLGSEFYKFAVKFNQISQAKFDLRYEIKTNYRETILNVLK